MAGASPIPLVTVVIPVVSVSVLGVVVVVTLPLEERGNPITWSQSWLRMKRHNTHPSAPAPLHPVSIPRRYSHPDCIVCNSLCICCTHNLARKTDHSLPCIDHRNYGNPEKGKEKGVKVYGFLAA